MIRYTLIEVLRVFLTQQGYPIDALKLETPAHSHHGDYAISLAFSLAKSLKQSPVLIAKTLASQLNEAPEISCMGTWEALNGFVNCRLNNQWIWDHLQQVSLQKTEYPPVDGSILVEYVSANPTGPLHIGHARWAVFGHVLVTLLKEVGISTVSEFYINDAGNQIELLRASVQAVRLGNPIPENGYHGDYIQVLATQDEDPLLINLAHHKTTLKALGIDFDTWFSETSLRQSGQVESVICRLREKGYLYEQEGALWFASSKWGDDKDRVLVKADGSYTYFAVDLAYHNHKVQRGFGQIINIWGADHHGYVARIRAGLMALFGDGFDDTKRFQVIIGQLVSLYRGGQPVRMSKRTGDMVTLEDVLEDIGSDAMRYFLVEKSADTHLEFDLELAKKKSADNPVFYVQYAHARLANILEKLHLSDVSHLLPCADVPDPWQKEERQLVLSCLHYQDVVWQATTQLAPHYLVQYTHELARQVQLFYETCPLLKASAHDQARRIWIVVSAKHVLAKALSLLGISAPDRM